MTCLSDGMSASVHSLDPDTIASTTSPSSTTALMTSPASVAARHPASFWNPIPFSSLKMGISTSFASGRNEAEVNTARGGRESRDAAVRQLQPVDAPVEQDEYLARRPVKLLN